MLALHQLSPLEAGRCVGSASISDRDFPQAFSSFYTQGKAIKLIYGTKSFLQLETNSLTLVMKQPKLLYPRARTRLKPREISTPHLLPGFHFIYFWGGDVSQQSQSFISSTFGGQGLLTCTWTRLVGPSTSSFP